MRKKRRIGLEQKKAMQGYLYVLPWVIGFFAFFLYPMIQTAVYSFNTLNKSDFSLSFAGWKNYYDAFRTDVNFPQYLGNSMLDLKDVLLILIFSFFVALLLRRKFPGSLIVKAIFFITILMESDMFLQLQSSTSSVMNAQMASTVTEAQNTFTMLKSMDVTKYFSSLGFSTDAIKYLNTAISNIFGIMVKSGIQVFIFLAALHGIPDSMYEAANMEGATQWETFWKVTFPMCGPMILVNFVYTVVDSFGSSSNDALQYIYTTAVTDFNFGFSAAMAWIYFLCISLILGVVFLIFGRKVFYAE